MFTEGWNVHKNNLKKEWRWANFMFGVYKTKINLVTNIICSIYQYINKMRLFFPYNEFRRKSKKLL